MDFKCVFCGGDRGIAFSVKEKEYYRCSECDGVFMAPKSRLSSEKQKERYLKHNNTLENSGYVDFLRSFIEPVLGFIKQQRCDDTERANMRILDYGSGPEPVLVELLEAYRKEGVLYSDYGIRDFEIRGWDPFFAAETQFFEGGADLVTCLEVAEHFESPDEDFAKLSSCVKGGGYLAVGTMLLPQGGEEAFKSWWYRSDATHVSFYTENALRTVAAKHGLSLVERLSDRIFVFKKDNDFQAMSVS